MLKKKKCSNLRFLRTIISLMLIISLVGCSFQDKDKNNGVTNSPAADEKKEEVTGMTKEEAYVKASEFVKNMTLEEKIGQLFVVNLEQLDNSKGSYFEWKKCSKEMIDCVKQYNVGGIILFSRNIGKRKQTKNLINKLQKQSPVPLFVSVDEEGGEVARIAGNPDMNTTKFPTMEEVGSKKDTEYVNKMGKTIGNEIKALGFNVDFAPVADVKTSDLNLEIGSRSFGSEPDKVASMVKAFVKGLQETNVSATLKHFPGQGSSKGDTHIENVNIDSSIAALRKIDFVPFEEGIKAGADFVMVSHISVSKVTETAQPASMSELIMKTILRDELGFKGIIITDAMDMASITDEYSSAEAALGSFEAGSDIILMPTDFKEAYEAVLSAAKSGEISMERVDESVQRILTVKFMRGVILPDQDKPNVEQTAVPDAGNTNKQQKNNHSKD